MGPEATATQHWSGVCILSASKTMKQWLCGAEMEAHSAGVTVRRYPTIEPPELTQDRGNRLLEGTDKIFCAPGPRRKEQ